jgi:hypothetical protein
MKNVEITLILDPSVHHSNQPYPKNIKTAFFIYSRGPHLELKLPKNPTTNKIIR